MGQREDIHIHIEEIRRQLWLGHASLMVGSGFSLNAEKASPTTPLPPDWPKLAQAFAKRLYPLHSQKELEDVLHSKNVLQLADEFDVTFKRPALNALLKELIQDDNLLPGELHRKILDLPWGEVFTTNYDTLLERTLKDIVSIKYDVTYTCSGLPYSESPRIVKLHGSFPAETTSLIVTEEDYREYPNKFSPFVNTVQQAIMESTLCLVGFSGTDPNFLKWIGWVRDNLRGSMPPIYLIGLLNLSASEYQVLQRRNIIAVDLLQLDGIESNDHKKALGKFLELLGQEPSYLDWCPRFSTALHSPSKTPEHDEVIKIIQHWQEERKTYPNWLVPPWATRSKLVSMTERWTISLDYLRKLSPPWDLIGLFELNWRLEKCLMPIWNNLIPEYEEILNRYNPFEIENWQESNKASFVELSEQDIKDMWRALIFAILRWSREEVDSQRWKQYSEILNSIAFENIDTINRLYYEKVLYAINIPDLSLLDEAVEEWDKVQRTPEWDVKYAAIISELGQTDKAISLLRASLNKLRPHIPKSRIKNDFYLLSLEGAILVGLNTAKFHDDLQSGKFDQNAPRNEYQKRLKQLESFYCNPWHDLDRFILTLSVPFQENKAESKARDFDSIKTSLHSHYGWPIEVTRAFQFIRFFEETGIPQHIGNTNIADKALSGAIVRIAKYSPRWAFSLLNKITSTTKANNELFYSQQELASLKVEEANHLVAIYITQLQYILTNKKTLLAAVNSNFYIHFTKNLFDVISRLTTKVDAEHLERIFSLGIFIYQMDFQHKELIFSPIDSRYFKRLFDAMRPERIYKHLGTLLSLSASICKEKNSWWMPPAPFVTWRGYKVAPENVSTELREAIDKLILQLDTLDAQVRSDILLSLNVCMDVNVLSALQKELIAKSLLKYTEKEEFPAGKNFHKFAHKELLAPVKANYDASEKLINYYRNYNFEFYKKQNDSVSFSPSGSPIVTFGKSFISSCSIFAKGKVSYIDLSESIAWEIFDHLKSSVEESYNALLENVNTADPWLCDIRANIRSALYWCDCILCEVLIPRISAQARVEIVKNLVVLMEQIMPCPSSHVALATKGKKFPNELVLDIVRGICQNDSKKCDLFSRALLNTYKFAQSKQLPIPPSVLLNSLLNAIGMKSDSTFHLICYRLGDILDYYSLTQDESQLLLGYLTALKEETSFDSSSTRFSKEDRLDYRTAVGFLAASLFKSYQKKHMRIPQILRDWENICHSDSEFPQLRNAWEERMND